ncbi:unnamed protein product [Didymodactylos carnosus]|uniref:Uncharacterized protein n=1 Tax=Didymodactylos carnosus TaxID=1234261 RepID=A0A814T3M6_9BILA|nr:unnamed protein product [Didymodactylos carnosus]CAF3919970.1 unnamed protein product [Didymodactylos carnosus]
MPDEWVFGGIDRDITECFAVTLNHRDAATLLPIRQQYVRPGHRVYEFTDEAYACIKPILNHLRKNEQQPEFKQKQELIINEKL